MDILRRQPLLLAVGAFILGFAIGLFLFGWYLTPVEYTGAGPGDLHDYYQQHYLQNLADFYSQSGNQQRVLDAVAQWDGAPQATCDLAAARQAESATLVGQPQIEKQAEAIRLNAIAALVNPAGCAAVVPGVPGTATQDEDGGGGLGTLLLVCGLLVLLGVLVGAIVYVLSQRAANTRTSGVNTVYEDMPRGAPVGAAVAEAGQGGQAVPIGRFQTTYTRGHDSYDDSFSIENTNGDFLGECGVGLSESIGTEAPKNVTAFEVWLFDKNDIRTVTKVIMSDHAFFDEAIKAKLAPKGEPVLARENETIALETASLIINAEIVEMEYGSGTLPPQSFFERFTVELSAWAKEGDFGEPDVAGRVDEILNF
jgi:hypothetical protein